MTAIESHPALTEIVDMLNEVIRDEPLAASIDDPWGHLQAIPKGLAAYALTEERQLLVIMAAAALAAIETHDRANS